MSNRRYNTQTRKNFSNGGNGLTKAQKTLPEKLQKLIKGKKQKTEKKKPSMIMMAMKGKR